MNMDFLKEMDAAWQGTAAKGTTYAELPEGDYQCKIETAQIKENKQGMPMLHWGMRIVSGVYAKRMVFKTQRLATESLPYLKADLELLGICPDKLSDLESQLAFALDAVVDVRVKNAVMKDGSPIQNVYFNRLVRAGQRTAQTAVPEGYTVVTDEDLPWETSK